MRFLKRGGDSGAAKEPDFAAFWQWWAGAQGRLAQAITDRTVDRHVDEISRVVKAMHPKLAWELGNGKRARHMFVVTPEGDAELRPIAIRWAQSAPPADETWEFYPSKQAGERGSALRINGLDVPLSEIRSVTSWDEDRERLSVRLWHPLLEGVPEGGRMQIAFLYLDDLIGEDQVERWLGTIDVDSSAQAGKTDDELAAEFARRAEAATGDRWGLAQGTDQRGEPVIARYNAALKHIDQPFANQHLEVAVERGLDNAGDQAVNDAIASAEEQLIAALEGEAIEVAHVTDRRRRVTHFVCEDGARPLAIAREWAGQHKAWGASAKLEYDPRWEFRRSYGE